MSTRPSSQSGTHQPRASIIIPAHNAAPFIGELLASLHEQVRDNHCEVILIDNCSTDQTARAAAPWQSRMDLRIVSASEMANVSYARNVGVSLARGRWLVFCDADDVVAPGWLEGHLRTLEGGASIVTGSVIDWDGRRPLPTDRTPHVPDYVLNGLRLVGSGNLSCERDKFLRVGGFDASFGGGAEDLDFCWRYQDRFSTVMAVCARSVIYYRLRSTLKARMKQQYLWERERMLLACRIRERGHTTDLVNWRIALRSQKQVLLFLLRRHDPVQADRAAQSLGRLAGHVRYALLRRYRAPDYRGSVPVPAAHG